MSMSLHTTIFVSILCVSMGELSPFISLTFLVFVPVRSVTCVTNRDPRPRDLAGPITVKHFLYSKVISTSPDMFCEHSLFSLWNVFTTRINMPRSRHSSSESRGRRRRRSHSRHRSRNRRRSGEKRYRDRRSRSSSHRREYRKRTRSPPTLPSPRQHPKRVK